MAALFVRNLHPGVAEWMIAERFSPAGHVESVHICRDRKTGASLGYAYVNFRHRHQAERALEMFNFEPLLDRPMHVMWSDREPAAKRTIQSAAAAIERRNGMMLNDREVTIKAEDRPSSQHHASNLFIKNLNSTIDDECLRMVFGQFGRVTSAKETPSDSIPSTDAHSSSEHFCGRRRMEVTVMKEDSDEEGPARKRQPVEQECHVYELSNLGSNASSSWSSSPPFLDTIPITDVHSSSEHFCGRRKRRMND
ncbi:hypothetical protein KOW79_016003 [Hemibagrus wyckioides]|uniref:RRM domain-containing protein n=1 Tax=Hemibagrus wyckioides TaxID=337641 RepID=A0A9D3SDY5_9TELE|nr:hypothetical protein KOW79_016003 [Hemibagrus wyckioides]